MLWAYAVRKIEGASSTSWHSPKREVLVVWKEKGYHACCKRRSTILHLATVDVFWAPKTQERKRNHHIFIKQTTQALEHRTSDLRSLEKYSEIETYWREFDELSTLIWRIIHSDRSNVFRRYNDTWTLSMSQRNYTDFLRSTTPISRSSISSRSDCGELFWKKI